MTRMQLVRGDLISSERNRRSLRITIPIVKSLGAGETIWDTEVRGFGVRRQRRDPVFVLKTRIATQQRFFTIGAYGKGWTVETARREAERLLGLIAAGTDPAYARDAEKLDPTMNTLFDRYLAEGCANKKPSTLLRDRSRIERHLRPLVGQIRLRNVTRATIERLMLDVTKGRTQQDVRTGPRGRSIVTGGAGAAIECAALLSSILTFAVRQELRTDNPALGIELRRKKRRRYPSADELSRVGEMLTEMEQRGADPCGLTAIRFLCLSGCRKGEALGLQWSHVNFARGVLCLPDTKTGPRDIPIGLPALHLLRMLPRITDNPYVFPGRVPGRPLVGLQKIWERVRTGAGIGDLRLHDLRHGFASVGVNRGVSLALLQGLLGHASPLTTSRYAHLQTDALRGEADGIAASISAALTPIRVPATPKTE